MSGLGVYSKPFFLRSIGSGDSISDTTTSAKDLQNELRGLSSQEEKDQSDYFVNDEDTISDLKRGRLLFIIHVFVKSFT